MKLGPRFTSLLGLCFIVLASFMMLLANESSPMGIIYGATFIYGLGFGFSLTIFTIIAQSAVGFELRGLQQH